MITLDELQDAKYQEQGIAQYRDYVAYLRAGITLHEHKQAILGAPAFEWDEQQNDAEQQARQTLAAIPPERTHLFEAVVEQERLAAAYDLAAGKRPADPDEALRVALTTLLGEATGETTVDKRGRLPRGQPDHIQWYAIDPTILVRAPTAASYAIGAQQQNRKRQLLLNLGGLLLIVLAIGAYLFIRTRGSLAPSTSTSTAQANGMAVTPWPIEAIAAADWTRPLSPTLAPAWPSLPAGAAWGWWQTDSLAPLRLCLPPAHLDNVSRLRLLGTADTPDRVFVLSDAPPLAGVDLMLESCERGQEATRRYGVLQVTEALPLHVVGSTSAGLTVQAVTLIGRGQDPSLPPGQARLLVRVVADQAIDWPSVAPTLLLLDNVARLPSDSVAQDEGVELRYLIPESLTPLELIWSITLPGQRPIRWQATLDPPPSRRAVLLAALEVREVTATVADNVTLRIQVTLFNRSQIPLQLTSADLVLAANDQVLASPDAAALRTPLAPQEQRTFVLSAPRDRTRLVLTVGAERFEIGERR